MSRNQTPRETTITIKPALGYATILTNNIRDRHRLDKLCADHPLDCRFTGNTTEQGHREYQCDISMIRLRTPPTAKQIETWRQAGHANAHHLPHMKLRNDHQLN